MFSMLVRSNDESRTSGASGESYISRSISSTIVFASEKLSPEVNFLILLIGLFPSVPLETFCSVFIAFIRISFGFNIFTTSVDTVRSS